MKYIAEVTIMPLKHLPDHQGKVINHCARQMGFAEIQGMRAGRHFRLEIEAESKEKAMATVNEVCNRFLCNTIVEGYEFKVDPYN